jgi:hypothetical protein
MIMTMKLRRNSWAEHVAGQQVLAVNSEERRSFGRHRHRWKDNIKTNLNKIG